MSTPSTGRIALQLGLVVAALAAVGALAGVVWQWIWTPTAGVVVDHRWTAGDALGLQHEFSGTGWYVVVGTAAGLLAGIVIALVADRVPLLTLAAVVIGSVVAAWLMLTVGTALGPADPAVLAKTAADGTKLPMQLTVSGRSPWISLPSGALIGLVLVFIGLSPRHPAPRAESVTDDAVAG
ncbi:hypothetical protein [Nocardioides conyzicola]|uniref:DUF2567 domain-containing protein n=1 Tax=Nocardioides conyzicola TaxID=1651781 RepID=A0ABP8Y3W4_9ACTN